MKTSRLEWRVGLFVLFGLVLLALLLLGFSKGMTFFHSNYLILLRSQNVSGLKVRAGVLMSGVQVGTVTDLKLAPDGKSAIITLGIYNQYRIHKDAQFIIEQSGFLGDQYVAILPTANQGDVFHNGDVAEAEVPFNLLQALQKVNGFVQHIDQTAQRLDDSIADVRRLVLNETTLTNLATMVGNFRLVSERALKTVDNIDSMVAANAPSIAVSASNLLFFSEEINQFAGALSNVLSTNAPQVTAAVKHIESSTAALEGIMAEMQAGKGLAGNLLKNRQLAADVSQIANNLSITTSNLNRLGLWGILWQHKPAGTSTNSLTPAKVPLTTPKTPFE